MNTAQPHAASHHGLLTGGGLDAWLRAARAGELDRLLP